jgi:hypothetical protein
MCARHSLWCGAGRVLGFVTPELPVVEEAVARAEEVRRSGQAAFVHRVPGAVPRLFEQPTATANVTINNSTHTHTYTYTHARAHTHIHTLSHMHTHAHTHTGTQAPSHLELTATSAALRMPLRGLLAGPPAHAVLRAEAVVLCCPTKDLGFRV